MTTWQAIAAVTAIALGWLAAMGILTVLVYLAMGAVRQ